MPHRALDRFQQRALDADGVIEAGRNLVRRVAVVDDVDAADEGQAAIHHGDLAVQAAQAMPSQAQVGQFRAVDEDLHAVGHQGRHQGPGKVPGAEAVGQDPHLEAAPGGPAEGGGDGLAGLVGLEDVGLQMHLPLRPVDGGQQGGEELVAAVEQGDPVAWQVGRVHGA